MTPINKFKELNRLLALYDILILSIDFPGSDVQLCYQNLKASGRKPLLEESRDVIDYGYKLESWILMGKFYSARYKNLTSAVDGEIEKYRKVKR